LPDADASELSAGELARLARLLEDTTRQAGELARTMQRADLRSWTKGASSPVSDADIAANGLIEARLRVETASFGWLSEESVDDESRLGRALCWIVDPIDGTRAYIAGRTDWCVSIALVEQDRPLLAAVYAPAADEMFLAQRGSGATLNGAPLTANAGTALEAGRMAGPKPLIERALRRGADIAPYPRIGSLALRLCRVADGKLDAAFAGGNSHDWDIAAADLIVAEAGGRLTTLAGAINRYNRKDVRHENLVAAGRDRHARIVARLGGSHDGRDF
jgi:myo-inositol-1(or 4)-monophosphatase